ncbi:MAG: TonB-dependent receptor [Chloroherpetonaceae bacterium]|nr:TonB-dependent receptor [Chloroherpetonaceae bacterium]
MEHRTNPLAQLIALSVCLCFFFFTHLFPLFAQSTQPTGFGTLRGTVFESRVTLEQVSQSDSLGHLTTTTIRKRTALPVIGARVALRGTSYGAITDTAGFYQIKGIPRGTYDIIYSAQGYKTFVFKSITIKSDTITEIDMALSPIVSEASEITVTADRYERKLQELSLSVSILKPDFIVERNSNTLDEALRYVSGVSFTNQTPNIRASSGVSFGVGNRVQLLLDNVPFLAPDDGSARWDAFPVDFIERVEVIKGASSALYGSAGLGGTINIVTRNDFQNRTSLLTYVGLFDKPAFEIWQWSERARWQSGFELSHAQNFGKFCIYGSLTRRVSDSYRENADFRRWRLFTKATYQFSDAASLSLVGTFAEEQRGNGFFWRNIDAALLNGSPTKPRIASDNLIFAPTLNLKLSSLASLIVRNRFYRSRFEDTDGLTSLSSQLGTDAQLLIDFGKGFIVTGGVEGFLTDVRSNLYGNHSAVGAAIYLQSDLPLFKSLIASFGVRADGLSVNRESLIGRFNPRFGLNWTLGQHHTLRGNFGTAFRNPTISERFVATQTGFIQVQPNPSLRPESSMSFELGYLFSYSLPVELFRNFALTNVSLDVAAFSNVYDNLIEVRPTPAGFFSFQNITAANVLGYEISSTFAFNQRLLLLTLSYTHTNPIDYTDAANVRWLRYRHRRLFYVNAEANVGFLTLEWNYRFLSRFDTIDPELMLIVPDGNRLVDAHISDARLGTRFAFGTVGFVVNLMVRNLFNYNYVEQPGSLAPIRHFILQVRASV